MKSENVTRRVDSLGRLVLPKGLRQKLDIKEGDEMEVFVGEDNGRTFVAFSKIVDKNEKAEEAIKLLEELGVVVPEELRELV